MRNLERDTQAVYISRFEGIVPEERGGRLTGKNIPVRTTPEAFYPSVTLARGEAEGAYFGLNLDYDRVLTVDDPAFEVGEADVLWVDAEVGDTEAPNPHDYIVRKVARKGSYTVIAVSRVEVRP
jgi:hypothetical protein